MSTAQDIISGALQDLGRIAAGETPTTTVSTQGLMILNEIVSSWSRDGQITYVEKMSSTSLSIGLDAYTVGVGGTFNTTAYPQQVKGARCAYNGFQQGVTVLAMPDFERRISNMDGTTASLIEAMGVDNAAPLRNARVYPMPNAACQVELSWWEPLTVFSALSSTFSFPVEGWEAAMRAELVVAWCPAFGLEATQTMAGNMQRFKARITGTGFSGPGPQAAPPQAPR